MVFWLGLTVVTGQLIVTLGREFGRVSNFFLDIVLAGVRGRPFDEGVVWIVGLEGEMVVEAEVEVEEVAVFVSERRGLPWVVQGIFFWWPPPHCPFSSSLCLFPFLLAGLVWFSFYSFWEMLEILLRVVSLGLLLKIWVVMLLVPMLLMPVLLVVQVLLLLLLLLLMMMMVGP